MYFFFSPTSPPLKYIFRGWWWIFTGFWGWGFRIASGFLPDLGEEAYGLLPDFYRIWGEEAYGLFPDFYRIWGRTLTDCLRIFTGFGGGGLRIVYGFLPDLGEEAYGLLTDFYQLGGGLGEKTLRIVSGLELDLGEKAYGFGAGGVWVLEPWSNSQLQLVLKSIGIHTARTDSVLFPLQNRCKGIHCLLSLGQHWAEIAIWATLGWDSYLGYTGLDRPMLATWATLDLIDQWSPLGLHWTWSTNDSYLGYTGLDRPMFDVISDQW